MQTRGGILLLSSKRKRLQMFQSWFGSQSVKSATLLFERPAADVICTSQLETSEKSNSGAVILTLTKDVVTFTLDFTSRSAVMPNEAICRYPML